MRALVTFLSGLFLLAVFAAGGGLYGAYMFEAPGPSTEDQVVSIRSGTGLSSVTRLLQERGVIDEPFLFKNIARIRGDAQRLRAGEYAIPAGASMANVLDILKTGKAILHKLTIPEGLSVTEALKRITTHETLTGAITLTPTEGSLKPDTYLFERGQTRDDLIKKMIAAQIETLDRLWESRAEGLPVTTKEEVLILASVVEKETGVPEERPMVAGVFVNRLRKGIRLQSDPTVVYGITGGSGPLGRGLRQSELKKKTPYNTYTIDGLPKGPIANPGEASIAAVLQPAQTKALFFVADGTGGHAFAETNREHLKNVRAWRKIEKQRKKQQQAN